MKTLRRLFRIVATKFFAIVRNRRRLIAGLGDPDGRVRLEATQALAKIGNADVVEPLITALSDSDQEVRSVAVGALGIIGDDRAVDALIGALSDWNQGVVTEAIAALVTIGDAQAVGPLIAILKNESGFASTKLAAAEGLKDLYRHGRLLHSDKQAILRMNGFVVAPRVDEYRPREDSDLTCASGGGGYYDSPESYSDVPERRFHL